MPSPTTVQAWKERGDGGVPLEDIEIDIMERISVRAIKLLGRSDLKKKKRGLVVHGRRSSCGALLTITMMKFVGNVPYLNTPKKILSDGFLIMQFGCPILTKPSY